MVCLAVPLGPAWAGQVLWSPGGPAPELVLSLGDGPVRRSFTLPSGAQTLVLTLRRFLLEDSRVVVTWRSGADLWVRQNRTLSDEESTVTAALPPGRIVVLEISGPDGRPSAVIRLLRS